MEFPFRMSKPVLSLPATRGRCPPRCAHAAARSISPVRGSRVSGTPAAPLYIFPLRLCFWDSFIPVRAAARSARTGSPLPSTRPSTYPCSPPPLPRGAQRPHLHPRRSDTLFSIIGPVNFFLSCFPSLSPHFCPLDFITGGITTEFSGHR